MEAAYFDSKWKVIKIIAGQSNLNEFQIHGGTVKKLCYRYIFRMIENPDSF